MMKPKRIRSILTIDFCTSHTLQNIYAEVEH